MNTEFTHNPILINKINLSLSTQENIYITDTILYTGVIPDDVNKSIISYIKKNKNLDKSNDTMNNHKSNDAMNNLIKNFYGDKWKTKFKLDTIIKGGNDVYDIGNFNINELKELNISNVLGDNNNLDIDADDLIDDNELDDKSELASKTKITSKTDLDDKNESENKTKTNLNNTSKKINKKTFNLSDVHIFPYDNILELKYKIYVTFNIPIYRQHLFFIHKSTVYPLNYLINIQHENIPINIFDLNNDSKTKVDNIPVDLEFYDKKNLINVMANDKFEILLNLYNKFNVTSFYLVDLEDIINPLKLYEIVKTDKYQMELIYYGFILKYFPMMTYAVFTEYLKNDNNFDIIYPELLPNKKHLIKKLELESYITYKSHEYLEKKDKLDIYSSVINTIIKLINYKQNNLYVVNIRNLFDLLELSESIINCNLYFEHNNRIISVKKTYITEQEIEEIQPLNTVSIKIKMNKEINETMKLVIYMNGNYYIKTEFREESHMDFLSIKKLAVKFVNPLIEMFNNTNSIINNGNKILSIEDNITFIDSNIKFYISEDFTSKKMEIFKEILQQFNSCNIMTQNETNANELEFFFNKGMYKYSIESIEKNLQITNYYSFLSEQAVLQKWNTIYTKTKIFNIEVVGNKIKINIKGVSNDIEMNIYILYIHGLINIYKESTIKLKSNEHTNEKSYEKNLKNLKIQDPLLYDFKKIYNSDKIYSKICQKPYQPVIISNDEYNKLKPEAKEKTVKYWNYTTQKEVWYNCPNAKYPYLKFIIKQHPKDFCIPCCKKLDISVENINLEKQKIHNTCLSKHIYSTEKTNVTKNSSYISGYGKDIEIGRLSRLPEHTLEPLFFDIYSESGDIDQECTTKDGYYLFGIDQTYGLYTNFGLLNTIAHSLNFSPGEFILEICKKIKTNQNYFKMLLHGNIYNYFDSIKDLIKLFSNLSINQVASELDNIPMDDILTDIAYYYFNLNIIKFVDTEKEKIKLLLPKYLNDYNSMFPTTFKYLITLTYKNKIYPVYIFNTQLYKQSGIINTKIYSYNSGLISIIKSIVKKTISQNINEYNKKYTLDIIKEFCSSLKYNIDLYYMNKEGYCYAVNISYKNKVIYFPIEKSFCSDNNIHYLPYDGKNTVDYDIYDSFIKVLNNWNIKKSKDAKLPTDITLYNIITCEKWLNINKTLRVIGFECNNKQYFINEITKINASKINDVPFQVLLFNPHTINMAISRYDNNAKISKNFHDLPMAKYRYNIDNIVLLHFINIFKSSRNEKIRDKMIKEIIKNKDIKNTNSLNNLMENLESENDRHKLSSIIYEYTNNHKNKKIMISDIDITIFDFDNLELKKMRLLPPDKLAQHLRKIASTFVKIEKKVKLSDFPNIIETCGKSEYCYKNKLIVTEKILKNVIDVIVSSAENETTWDQMFNILTIQQTLNIFKFIKRKNEILSTEIF